MCLVYGKDSEERGRVPPDGRDGRLYVDLKKKTTAIPTYTYIV